VKNYHRVVIESKIAMGDRNDPVTPSGGTRDSYNIFSRFGTRLERIIDAIGNFFKEIIKAIFDVSTGPDFAMKLKTFIRPSCRPSRISLTLSPATGGSPKNRPIQNLTT
jgi:hypothetical protein